MSDSSSGKYGFMFGAIVFVYFVGYISALAGSSVINGAPTLNAVAMTNPVVLIQTMWSLANLSSTYALLSLILGAIGLVLIFIVAETIISLIP
jgi:hypothetical protein